MADFFSARTNNYIVSRKLYVIAYDITDEKRITQMRCFLSGYSVGGQKSVYECYLTEGELETVIGKIREIIVPLLDRVHIFLMDGRSKPHLLGKAVPPQDPQFFYVG